MRSSLPKTVALALAAAPLALIQPLAANAQAAVQPIAVDGTLLDISASGSVKRVPDLAIIDAGVETQSATASGAISANAARMAKVLAALEAAGIDKKDIQTSSINLNPDYRYERNETPKLMGYRASNTVTVKFRDLKNAGKILDALVAQGANRINGPRLTIDKPDEALDEARLDAIKDGRRRAELYARALGKRVHRVVAISESGRRNVPMIMMRNSPAMALEEAAADTMIEPGEQDVSVSLSMTFELR